MLARERERPRGQSKFKIPFDKQKYLENHPHYVGVKNAQQIAPAQATY
jgi:hypothetical protein